MFEYSKSGRLAARYLKSLATSNGDGSAAAGFALAQSWNDSAAVARILKAAVTSHTTADLTAAMRPMGEDFAEYLRPATVIGRLTGVRRVPFQTRMFVQTGGAVGAFVSEGQTIPFTKMDFDSPVSLAPARVAALTAVTQELARSTAPGSEMTLIEDVRRAVALAADLAFLDPGNGGSGDLPAAVTYGAPTIMSSGSTIAAIDNDLQALIHLLTDCEEDLSTAAWAMSARTASFIASLRGSGGAPAFPGVTARGGELLGLPVLVSNCARQAGSPGGAIIALISAGSIMIADDGDSAIDLAESAALQLNDAPVEGARQTVSMFQTNSIAIRATRWMNWARARDSGVAVLTGVGY